MAFGDAGGINAFDTIVTIQNSEISNNSADGNGGGIYSMPQSLGSNANALVIMNSTIIGNSIRNFGGGIRVQGVLGEFSITNCLITENKAVSVIAGSNQGGGIYFSSGSTLTLSDGQVTGNMKKLYSLKPLQLVILLKRPFTRVIF
ncbi:hypothetical protein [Lysinibacillus sp. RC46]|uniref:hypothetical protein n=1 Tax=unclassified Lysinibacillus TaxID=2636778 RepID=UPI0035148B88